MGEAAGLHRADLFELWGVQIRILARSTDPPGDPMSLLSTIESMAYAHEAYGLSPSVNLREVLEQRFEDEMAGARLNGDDLLAHYNKKREMAALGLPRKPSGPPPIITDGRGRPISRPCPPPFGAPIEEKVSWCRADSAYRDKVFDIANASFAAQFARSLK